MCSIGASNSTCPKPIAFFCPLPLLDYNCAFCIFFIFIFLLKKEYLFRTGTHSVFFISGNSIVFFSGHLKLGIFALPRFLPFSLPYTSVYYLILSPKHLLNIFLSYDLIDCAIVQTLSSFTSTMITATTRPHCVQPFYLESLHP